MPKADVTAEMIAERVASAKENANDDAGNKRVADLEALAAQL